MEGRLTPVLHLTKPEDQRTLLGVLGVDLDLIDAHTHPSTSVFYYRFSANTAMADPGAGQYRINTGLFTTSTALALDVVTDNGTDVTSVLSSILAGDLLYVQTQASSANWARYQVTATPTNQGGWFQIPVTPVSSGGSAPNNNAPCLIQVTMGSGGGGGGGMTNPMTAPEDLIKGGAGGTPTRFARGAEGQVMIVYQGQIIWATPTWIVNPMSAVGDMVMGGTAGQPMRLAGGTNNQILTFVGGFPSWQTPASSLPPNGAAGGDLTGTYPSPQLAPGVIVDGDVAAANKDGTAATPSLRTLGAGAQQAAAGNHAHAASAAENELTNPGLETWARGNGPFTAHLAYGPDAWRIELSGGSILSVTPDTTNVDAGSGKAAALAYTHAAGGAAYLGQALEGYAQLRGRTVTFAVRVQAPAANRAWVRLVDGTTTYDSGYNATTAYETLALTVAVPATATALRAYVGLTNGTGTVYLDNATLWAGSAALAYAPLHPAEELIRCQRYYQEIGGLDTNEFLGTGQNVSTTAGQLVLRYPVEMYAAPTVTVSAPGDWQVFDAGGAALVCTALNIGLITRRSLRVQYVVAAGLVAGNAGTVRANSTAAARIRLESNP